MDNRKNDKYFAQKAIDNIDLIQKYIKGKNYDEFIEDTELNDAIMFRLVQLIENVKNISQAFKDEHNQIPWVKIIGFRNGIVHEYGETDYHVVYEVITINLIELKSTLELITE